MAEQKPISINRRETEASHLLRFTPSEQAQPIMSVEVKAHTQTHVSLGDFTDEKPPIGFPIEVTPDYDPKTVVARVTRLDAAFDEYELVLHVTNNTDEVMSVEVQQL